MLDHAEVGIPMLGHVIRRYGPTTMLIVIAVILWAGLEGAGRRLDAQQSFSSQRFNRLEGRINNLEQGQAGLQAQIAEMRERLARVESMVEAIEEQLTEIAGGLALQGIGGPNGPR